MNLRELIDYYRKPLIIIAILLILLVVPYFLNKTKSDEEKVKDYIISKEFIIDSNGALYEKRLSDTTKDDYDEDVKNKKDSTFDMLYFDIYSYTLTETLYNYTNEVESSLSARYDYKNDEISYNYQVTYETSNIIFRGNYKNNKLKCENEYSFDAYIEGSENDYCNIIEKEIKEFKNKSMKTITSTRILNIMKK